MIILERVRKSWDGGATYTVDGVSLEVGRGEFVVLLGESGCGKTTTLKMINRLVEPSDGRIEVDGRDVMQSDPIKLRRSIGYVFQSVGLFPHMSVADNVAVVPRLLGWEKERVRARVEELLALVQLPAAQFADRRPDALSGGQRQRVGFARALAAAPNVLLLDEPFGALDPLTRDALQQELKQLQRELKLTALMVTHDVSEALALGDRIAVMEAGKLAQVGSPEALLASPKPGFVASLMETPRRQLALLKRLASAQEAT